MRGRYFWAGPDAPFYPGLHNRWSSVWTNDEREPEPETGEFPTGRTIYQAGGLPIPTPPAITVGSAACLRGEVTFSAPPPDRTMPAGIDSRCYSQVGEPVPSRSPLVWLRPDELPDVGPIAPGDGWFPGPDTAIPALASGEQCPPLVDSDGYGKFATVRQRFFTEPLPAHWSRGFFVFGFLPTVREYTVYCVAQANITGPIIGTFLGNQWVFRQRLDRVEWQQGPQTVQAFTGFDPQWHLWRIRRGPATLDFARDGLTFATFFGQGETALQLDGLDMNIGNSGLGSASFREVKVFPYATTSDEDRVESVALALRYGLLLRKP